MELEVKKSENGTNTLVMRGKFMFEDNQIFYPAVKEFENDDVKKIELDMSGVEYMDSHALGMVCVFIEKAKQHSKDGVILNPKGQVKKIFDTSKIEYQGEKQKELKQA